MTEGMGWWRARARAWRGESLALLELLMSNTAGPIMSWNIRGLNNPARRSVVEDTANTHYLAIPCIQETKLEEWTPVIAREVGGPRLDDCIVLPANGTRGGVAIFWDSTSV